MQGCINDLSGEYEHDAIELHAKEATKRVREEAVVEGKPAAKSIKVDGVAAARAVNSMRIALQCCTQPHALLSVAAVSWPYASLTFTQQQSCAGARIQSYRFVRSGASHCDHWSGHHVWCSFSSVIGTWPL